ncbi:MAG: hypothetical protein Kow0090_00290 [Myxococcota bacterium]
MEDGGEKLSQTERATTLADFTISIVKTLLKSGYYSTDHPEAMQAINSLYAKFKEFISPDDELSYVLLSSIEKQDILIEGLSEEAALFSKALPPGMAEMFTPKFYDYLSRHNLISISLIGRMEFKEWLGFINAMNLSTNVTDILEQHRLINKIFEDEAIRNIKIIFNEDIVGQKRQLSWRVKLALAKLNKDISQIPALKNKSEKELASVKMQIFEDILRPLKQANFIAELLVNIDLIDPAVVAMLKVDPLNEVVFRIQPLLLVQSAYILLNYQTQLSSGKPANLTDDEYNRRMQFVPQLVLALVKRAVTEEFPEEARIEQFTFLEKLYHSKIIAKEQLPKKMLEFLESKQIADELEKYPQSTIEALLSPKDTTTYTQLLKKVLKAFEELSRRKNHDLFWSLLKAILNHNKSALQNPYASINAAVFADYGSERFLNDLKYIYQSISKQEREMVAWLFKFIGPKSTKTLIAILKEADDMWVRKNAMELLKSFGAYIIPDVKRELLAPGTPWFLARNLLDVLGDVGMISECEDIEKFLKSEHPKVRETAILALSKVGGELGEERFIEALNDKEEDVVVAAIQALRAIGSVNPRTIRKYLESIEWKEEGEEAAPERIQVASCLALGDLGNVRLPGGWMTEEALLRVLRPHASGLVGKIFGKSEQKPTRVLVAAITALGRIGGEKSLEEIKRFLKSKEKVVLSAAEEAIKNIERVGKAIL